MCHKYGGKHSPAYARLCYLTGRAGERIPLTDEQATNWNWGMFHSQGEYPLKPTRRQIVKRSKDVFSTWNLNGANEDVVIENARYLDAKYTIDWHSLRVVFYHEKGISHTMKDRVRSFGLTEWLKE
jgi:hypothetical protein